MNSKWKKELDLITSLGKLYPVFGDDVYYHYGWQKNNHDKAWWVYNLCKYQLKCRLPQLEEFIREHNWCAWNDYKKWFNIKND